MGRTRFRTKLVLSLIFTTAVLSGASLLIVHDYLRNHAEEEIYKRIPESLLTFREFEKQLETQRSQSATMAAGLPTIQSVMTLEDEVTIRDTALEVWKPTTSDLFVLANPESQVKALLSSGVALDREFVQARISEMVQKGSYRDWWFDRGRLYEVFLHGIYRGAGEDRIYHGVLVMGYAVDERLAATAELITSMDVAFRYGNVFVGSTLSANQQQELSNLSAGNLQPEKVVIGGEQFVVQSIEMPRAEGRPVTMTLFESFDAATEFLKDVNQLLLGVGVVALITGSLLMFLISHTLTRPLSKLASGVVALQKGDFSYPLNLRRQDEVGELTLAFDTMRKSLKESQQHLLQAERLATIGRMASTISHDLRHPLTTVLAYAELLSEGNVGDEQRAEMYRQIRSSVNNMAELIASLLEFSKAQEALQLTYGDCVETLQDTIRAVKLKPEFQPIQLTLLHEGPTQGWFDFAKLSRVFSNLLRNACEAVAPDSGYVRVVALGGNNRVEISVSDNGRGIPHEIRNDIFQPFVTFGKADGTGLGLAVVQKIDLDHGGEVAVESTGSQGTTFRLTLPVSPSQGSQFTEPQTAAM